MQRGSRVSTSSGRRRRFVRGLGVELVIRRRLLTERLLLGTGDEASSLIEGVPVDAPCVSTMPAAGCQ
jgi:hypothetical protein